MIRFLFFCSCLHFFIACNNDISNNSSSTETIAINSSNFLKKIKYHPQDPFIKTIKNSEFFDLSGLKEHVIETTNGTIISIPKGAFLDQDGNIVEKEIRLEVTDISSLEEQISSNISSDYQGKLLQNGATLFINATKDGQQLVLNEDSPIYIKTSLNTDENDLLIFEGIRNKKGQMQWLSPKKPKQYLMPVNLVELDFLPENFALEVQKGMPFRNHVTANKKLIDSLYYSFGARTIIAGDKYDTTSVVTMYYEGYGDHGSDSTTGCTSISPASIKVIKGKKFSKTFIATKAFEKRMKFLHKARDQKALEIYTKNLTSNLSVCDSLVAQILTSKHPIHLQFLAFSHQNWGNIKNIPPSVKKLGSYYTKKLKSTTKELTRLREDYEKTLKKKSIYAQKKKEEYQTTLHKRLEYRIDKFGFKLDRLGWITLAKALEPIEKFSIEIKVGGGVEYDRVHVYTIDKQINSIFAFVSDNNYLFKEGYNGDPHLLYKKNQDAKVLVVAHKNTTPFYAIQEFKVTPIVRINLVPKAITKKELQLILKGLDNGHKKFNKIKVDLTYQAFYHKENTRLSKLQKEQQLISKLRPIALPCLPLPPQ